MKCCGINHVQYATEMNLINAMWIRTLGSKTFLPACGKCLIEQKNKLEIKTPLFGSTRILS